MNRRSKFFDENFKKQAIFLFDKGLKSKEICKILGISKTALIRNLNLLGYNFDRSISMQKYRLNRDYFEEINSFEKAYWLGLIYADGSNKVLKNTFVLGLMEEDSYILELLKNELEYTNSLKVQKGKGNKKDFFRLEIFNKKICLDLLKHGVFQNKTATLKPPSISEEYIFSFIRGYFDGDGGFVTHVNEKNHYKDSINFTGTKEVVCFIKDYLKDNLGIHCSLYERHPDRDNNNFTITVSGRLNVIKLCEKLYENKSDHYLVRKYEKFLKIKNRYE